MNNGLEQLREKRRRWVQANRENNFEDGVKRLLTDLYPDNAHFIYELLQNAEDTGATTVRFTLTPGELQFEHDGTRLFDSADVESITSIADSTKKDDPTSVGKFGVGFKAVFAYTTTPEIHSGNYQFRIHDLVVPDDTGVSRTQLDEQETRFVFPFDHPGKSASAAVDEIGRALRELDANTLLFLRHISTVEYLLPDASLGVVERRDGDDGVVEVIHRSPDGTTESTQWLHFTSDVPIQGASGVTQNHRVAIAYALSDRADGDKHAKHQIKPVESGQVCIYFPATKETSNLKFHLHAPFASTVARDSVRDCEGNQLLRDGIAELVAASLKTIRDMDLLTMDFLGVLPNPDDNLNPFYGPIRERIVEAFHDQPLIPTRSRQHARVECLYRGPARIADVLDDDDLSTLTGHEPPLWAANAPQQNQRPDRFLASLDIDEWGWSKLAATMSDCAWNEDERAVIEQLVKSKDDRWLCRFYSLLGEARDEHHENVNIDDLQIVRVSAGGRDEHISPSNAFFIPNGATLPPARASVRFVKPSTYTNARSKRQTQLAESFLEYAGVKVFNEAEALKHTLKAYDRATSIPTNSKYYHDINALVSAWKRKVLAPRDFTYMRFLIGVKEDGDMDWCAPSKLILDSPYSTTGLKGLSDIHHRRPVSPAYLDHLPKNSDFNAFLQDVGVMGALRVVKAKTDNNPERDELRQDWLQRGARWTSTAIDEDYTITGLERYLQRQSIEVSRLLWKAVVTADCRCATARFRPNQQYLTRRADSQMVQSLKGTAWVPDKAGEFHRPCDCRRDDLPSDFVYDDHNGMLTAIEFGKHAREQDAAYQERNQSAQQLGFGSAEEATQFATVKRETGATPEDFAAFMRSRKATLLPESQVLEPDRRAGKVRVQAADAPNRESILRERSVDPSASNVVREARAYLRAMYTNAEQQLVCQCCHDEMPFKVNGEYYFEAIQCVRGPDKHYHQNCLALCPTCAAMYQHARETDDAQVSHRLCDQQLDGNTASVSIEVKLAGNAYQLYFVGKHWFDLRTVLSNESEVPG